MKYVNTLKICTTQGADISQMNQRMLQNHAWVKDAFKDQWVLK